MDIKDRLIEKLRPVISPLEPIVRRIPKNAQILDVGCGTGILLRHLASRNQISKGVGFDLNPKAIETANSLAISSSINSKVNFQVMPSSFSQIRGPFDGVVMVDVMHHVKVDLQVRFLKDVISKVAPGGFFVYKDMVDGPWIKAQFNRLHDFLSSGDRINYFPVDRLIQTCLDAGFEMIEHSKYSVFLYGHELVTFRKTPK
jgi:2-polyprenyl-3-methyl-5-hydroxy-6-metoxy-1,4-benzoquinol methylase